MVRVNLLCIIILIHTCLFPRLVNQNADSSYIGSIAIGTPAVAYDVILDTGSADLWLAGSTCSTGCSQIQTFDTSSSSTFNNLSTSFSITYGSGAAAGALGSDVVQMAGFEVSSQTFGALDPSFMIKAYMQLLTTATTIAVCDEISSGLLSSPASGLFGLAWQSIASSGATPFWEALYESSVLDSPLFAFQLTRYQKRHVRRGPRARRNLHPRRDELLVVHRRHRVPEHPEQRGRVLDACDDGAERWEYQCGFGQWERDVCGD